MNNTNVLLESSVRLNFPLAKYGYVLEKLLNNENRWHAKIVCSILGRERRRYVSTTYAQQHDYLKLIETIIFLESNHRLSPSIKELFPKDNTVVCEYIGEFLPDFLLKKPADVALSLVSIRDYFDKINSINQHYGTFVVPPIIKISLELSNQNTDIYEFLPYARLALPRLESSGIPFLYGYGIEDPHIWNFRIIKTPDKTQALTTDFDYFSDRINSFWELGYLYATFRWFRKISFSLTFQAEGILLSLVQKQDLRAEFMFWLGVLSSYCGYRDSICNLITNGEVAALALRQQYRMIRWLDEKISCLANRLL